MSDDRLFLIHIQECIQRIEQYTAGGESEFLNSTLIQDAVLRNLQTLAESTQRLSNATKAAFPNIDWRAIAGFRNILVHNYLGVDVSRLWAIIVNYLPALSSATTEMLAHMPDKDA